MPFEHAYNPVALRLRDRVEGVSGGGGSCHVRSICPYRQICRPGLFRFETTDFSQGDWCRVFMPGSGGSADGPYTLPNPPYVADARPRSAGPGGAAEEGWLPLPKLA